MLKKFLSIGDLILISRSKKSIRKSLIFLFSNFLLIIAIIFTLEMFLILLGINNIFLPIGGSILNLFVDWFF
jgi:hypothetical protein